MHCFLLLIIICKLMTSKGPITGSNRNLKMHGLDCMLDGMDQSMRLSIVIQDENDF
jgi:hypothetical protein